MHVSALLAGEAIDVLCGKTTNYAKQELHPRFFSCSGKGEERQLPGDHDEGLQEEGHHQELRPSGGYFLPSPAKNHATSYLFKGTVA